MIYTRLIPLIIGLFTISQGLENTPGIKVTPSSRLTPGSEATFICKIDPRWTSNTVFWWRRTGQILEKLGTTTVLEKGYMDTKRYTVSQWGEDSGTSYRLSIKDVHLEDSAEIGCSVRGSDIDPYFASLAVCEDTKTFECQCMQKTGWISPDCFTKHPSLTVLEDRYNRTRTGLGVCLAIAIIYGLVMTVLAGWDCSTRMAARRNRKKELAKMRKSHDPGMYEGDEVKLDPMDTSTASYNASSAPPLKEEKRNHYTKLNSAEASHSNPAFHHDEDGYQELRETDQPSPYRRYPNSSQVPQPTTSNDYRPPASPRSPAADPYPGAYSGYEDVQQPPQPSWTTKQAAPSSPRYPEPQRSPMYNEGTRGYPERPPPPSTHTGYAGNHLQPRGLQFVDERQSSPYNNLSHSNYEEYAPNHSGSYIDKTDTVV